MNQVETIELSDIFLLANVLARKAISGGDVDIKQLAAAIGKRVVLLTIDSNPNDIHAVVALIDGLSSTMDRLAAEHQAAELEAVTHLNTGTAA